MSFTSTWFNGKIERPTLWAVYQAAIATCVFLILSHSFYETIMDITSPDIATLVASLGAGMAAIAVFLPTHQIRQSPLPTSHSVWYVLSLLAIAPVCLYFGQEVSAKVYLVCSVVVLLCAASWRPPNRKRASANHEKIDEEQEVHPESNLAIDPPPRMSSSIQAWNCERICLGLISLAFFSGFMSKIPESLTLVLASNALIIWLNAPALIPPGVVNATIIAFVVRNFHLIAQYNLTALMHFTILPGRLAGVASIMDWDFWQNSLASSLLYASMCLGKEGIPMDQVDKLIEKSWVWIWRLTLTSVVGLLSYTIYFWCFQLIPQLARLAK